MIKSIGAILLALAFWGCGMQNTSVLTQQFIASRTPFADIKQSTILFEAFQQGKGQVIFIDTLNGLTIDAVTGGISADSLNRLCFEELRDQLARRFPAIRIVDQSAYPLEEEVGFEFRLDSVEVIYRNEAKMWVNPNGVDKATLAVKLKAFDKRSNGSPLFSIQSTAEVLMINYKNPWRKAAQLNAARIADYIESNGHDYTQ